MAENTERVVGGRYRLIRRLGAGGMGQVWLAYDEELTCEVALKEISIADDGEDDPKERIARARAEARFAARLRSSPHVVTVHDVVEHGGLPWIVMEYVPGAIDLAAVVAGRGPLSPQEAARIGLGVLGALVEGHQLGIMHRDVKPANILLAPDGRALLTDYGIAVRPQSQDTRLTRTGVIGTLGYLAPERVAGGQPTPAADLFALGATLYFTIEGREPFPGGSGYGALAESLIPPRYAGRLEPLLERMLAKDPAHRSSADQAEAELRRFLTPRPPVVSTPDGRRGAVLLAVGAAMLAAAITTAIAVTVAYRQHPATPQAKAASSVPPTGPPPGGPYGFAVGLGEQLKPGDCVFALWSGEKFASVPKLSLTGCAKDSPDGQVIATPAVATQGEARARCEKESAEPVLKMAEAVSYALPPSQEAWDRGIRNVACLVLSRSGSGIGGPVGPFRKRGDSLLLQNAQIGDCTDYVKDKQGNELMHLLDCNRTHRQQVVGFVRIDNRKKAWDQCVKQYKARWVRDDSMTFTSWTPGDTTFDAGFHFALCALVRTRAPDLSQPITPKAE